MSLRRLHARDFAPFPRSALEGSLTARFARQVAAHGGRLAVKHGHEALSYAELDRRANRIAHALLARGHSAPRPVVLLVGQGCWLVAAILGVLKAGHLYVPLDPTHPLPRLAEAIDDADPSAVVADAPHLALAREVAGRSRSVLELAVFDQGFRDQDPALAIGPEALAYIFYTSGSTGRPKGVVDSHRNVLHNVMRYTNNLRIGPDDRLTLLQSASFSGTVSTLFGALLNGASVFPYDLRRDGLGRPLAEWLIRERVTMYHSVPAIFRSFLEGDVAFPDVRVVRLEGDAATRADVDLHRQHFPSALLAIGLGATETGLSCQLLRDADSEPIDGLVPIGFPAADMDLAVRDEAGRPLPAGQAGELTVTSPFLAVGYWRRPDLTAAAFTSGAGGGRTYRTGDLARIRPDGCVEYLGRKDHRLRVRGQTVEAADVEAALLRTGRFREAAVTAHGDASGEARLVAYVVPSSPSPSTFDPRESRASLAAWLPAHMVPSAFVPLASLPVTATGKLDRASLGPPPATPFARPLARPLARRAPRDDLEATLANVWEKALGVTDLGIDEDFLDLGGDSLLAAQVSAAIDRRVGRRVPADAVLAHGTVEGLAQAIRRGLGLAPESSLMPMRDGGELRPFFMVSVPFGGAQRFEPLARCLGRDRPFYLVRPLDTVDFASADLRLESVAARRIQDLAAVQPVGPYLLGGYCYGAVVAFEMARQLRAAGEDVALLALCQVTAFDFPTLVSPLARWRQKFHQVAGERVRHLVTRLSHHRRRSLQHPGGPPRYLVDMTDRLRARFVSRVREAWSPVAGGAAVAGSPVRVEEAAFRRYLPRRYPGDVLLLLSEAETRRYARDARAAWAGLAEGDVAVYVFGGRPGVLMDEPEVIEVGGLLREELARAEAAGPGTPP